MLDRSPLHTASCCREGACHSQQLSLSKPVFNYKSVKVPPPSPNNHSFSLTVIFTMVQAQLGINQKRASRIQPQLLTFCPLNKATFDQESPFPSTHSLVLGDIFRTALYLGSFTQDFLHFIFQDSPKVNQMLLIPRYPLIHTQVYELTNRFDTKPLERKKNSRPRSLAHQWILISVVMQLTCKSTGSLTQTFCAVTLQNVASYLDTTVFPTLPLLWMQSSAPKERGAQLEFTQIQATLNVTAALPWLYWLAAWHLPR